MSERARPRKLSRSPQQWQDDVLASLTEAGWWLTAYDLTYRLTGAPRGLGNGRITQKIRGICEQLAADGLAERREIRPIGAPYGKPTVEYRALVRTKAGTVLTMDDIERLAAEAERGYDADQLRERTEP